MSATDDREITFRVPLDDETVARLMELSEICHTEPTKILSSIVRDVLKDDEDVHMLESRLDGGGRLLN